MKFYIDRVSQWGRDENLRPCDDAVDIDGRWVVDIRGVRGLINFIKKEGTVIVDENSITIFDDYLE